MDTKNLVEYLMIISNKNIFVNAGMHLLILVSMASIYLLKDMKVRKYVVEGTILALFLSVTINAAIYGNPFHAITFGIMAALAVYVLAKGKNMVTMPQQGFRTMVALLFIFLGFWYPEIVKANIFESLLISPVGVVPCPTLLVALGMLNMFYPNISKVQLIVTAFFGIIYGAIGTFKLGVYFDLWLIGATLFAIYNIFANKAVSNNTPIKI